MAVFNETRLIIGFLVKNGYFGDETMEFTIEIYNRIGNDKIKIIGNGEDDDMANLGFEFETLKTFGYIPNSEPTMVLLNDDGLEITILKTELPWDHIWQV